MNKLTFNIIIKYYRNNIELFPIILIICMLSSLFIGCGKYKQENKYTKSDNEFLDNIIVFMQSSVKNMEEIEYESRRWPHTNMNILNKNIGEINNIIEKAYLIEKSDNKILLSAYMIWIKSLNNMKICLELLQISIKYQDKKILERATFYLKEHDKDMVECRRIFKEDLK